MKPTETQKKRGLAARTFDLFKDQIAWLDNSDVNRAKLIRRLLDEFIQQKKETEIAELKKQLAEQKEIILALGGDEN